jgi:WD40 repeat protein/tRNA A-37 threonylcarbamoyl transferase component Bud32
MPPPSCQPNSSQQGLLEEVLGEYMERLDRGEVVDREHLLAQYPELAKELQSYFAGSDEVEHLGRQGGGAMPALSPSPARREAEAPTESPAAEGVGPCVGDYDLLEQIGQGGMGVIYKARQWSLRRLVALKMIRTDRLASFADRVRFRTEAEAVASLDHPHIVPVYEVGIHEGQPFFSMKLIGGGSLAEHLPRFTADLRAGAALLAAVARAVHYAHQRGLLHRDLKPGNILLDDQGCPHVTDFGLAKRLGTTPGDASLTQHGVIVGTPAYMAPEQAATRGGVSTATDVYSLGTILYELLTGQPPFCAETPLDTLRQVLDREPASPRSLNRRVDRDLETVCLKCLQKEPQKRYASAEALADDLERWLRGEPIRVRPVSRRERVLKWARRRPHMAALAALLLLTLLAGLAGVCWQWRRAEQKSLEAQRTAYARGISLAYAEWLAGNAGPADQVLTDCGHELRGWEWHYLRRLFQVRQLATLKGHSNGVLAVAFSPDGARVASAGADGAVRVWDRRTLREALTLRGHADQVTALAFSPDGKSLASGSADGEVRLWHAAGGQRLAAFQAHAGRVTGLAFDPAGRRLASTGEEPSQASRARPTVGELIIWDASTGKALVRRASQNLLTAVAFSPDGKYLVAVGRAGVDDETASDLENDAALHPVFNPVNVTAFDPVTLTPGDTFKGQTQRAVLWTSVAFSADGKWLAAGSAAGLVRVWEAATTREHFTQPTPGQAGVCGLAFGGPDGRTLAAATTDNTVWGWYTRSGKFAFALRGHTRVVKAVACSPDGRCLASGGEDGTVKLWDLSRRDDDLTLRWPNQGVTSVAFSPDGHYLASATRDKALKVWDAATGKWTLTLRRLPGVVNGLAFGPGGQLAGACGDGKVHVWDIPSGRERLCLLGSAPLHAVAFGPGGQLASAARDGTIRVWEIPSGRQSLCLLGAAPAQAVAFSPDGTRLAAGCDDGSARVWDAATGQELPALHGHRGPVHAVAFSPDGRYLATASQDGAVWVWDASTGEQVRALRNHAGAVRSLAYSREGRLASAGDDKAVRVWDPAGRELLALRGHTEPLRALAFSPEGHRLASASDDGTIKIWDGAPLQRSQGRSSPRPGVGSR